MLRRFDAWMIGVIAIAAIASAVVGFPAVPASSASEPAAVGVHTVTFVDKTRSTPADIVAGITPADERRLPTTIYYPAKGKAAADGAATRDARPRGGRYPMVLFAGGAPGEPSEYAPLLQDWAVAGYVVVAPAFPVSSYAGPDDVAYTDLPRQSGDLRFVLKRVLALNPEKVGIPVVNAKQIAVAGHSFGGQTALSLVAKCCRTSRVDVALVLAGVTNAPGGPELRKVRGPVLFVHSRNDRAVPYGPTRDTCATVTGWKRMLTVEDLRGLRAHVEPYVGSGESSAIVRPATVDFLDGYLRDDAAARRRLGRTGAGTTAVDFSGCGSDGGGAR
jgi:dienelactone hydrolase